MANRDPLAVFRVTPDLEATVTKVAADHFEGVMSEAWRHLIKLGLGVHATNVRAEREAAKRSKARQLQTKKPAKKIAKKAASKKPAPRVRK